MSNSSESRPVSPVERSNGNSNRVSAIAQGPKKVIFIVGMNKVCGDVDGAVKRARNVAALVNRTPTS